jgi:hypothetical protein
MSVAGAAALSACACGPVFVAVCNVSLSRPFARLSASAPSVELMAAGAAALAALSAAAQLSPLSGEWFLLLGPPWIGAAPWVAGEIVAGPSTRQEGSFAAAVVTAYGAGVIAVCSCTHVLCQTVAIGAAAAIAYLCVRGGLRS